MNEFGKYAASFDGRISHTAAACAPYGTKSKPTIRYYDGMGERIRKPDEYFFDLSYKHKKITGISHSSRSIIIGARVTEIEYEDFALLIYINYLGADYMLELLNFRKQRLQYVKQITVGSHVNVYPLENSVRPSTATQVSRLDERTLKFYAKMEKHQAGRSSAGADEVLTRTHETA